MTTDQGDTAALPRRPTTGEEFNFLREWRQGKTFQPWPEGIQHDKPFASAEAL